jgi:hypothetical protein
MSSITELKSYQALLDPNFRLLIQSYGETGLFAIGFQGSDEQITKWHNLFSNFDSRDRDGWNEFPKSPRLCYVSPSLAYISLSKERLR